MQVYIASSLKNHIYNIQIANALTEAGFSCFLPQSQSYNQQMAHSKYENENIAEIVYKNNIDAIRNSDLLLVVAHQLGTDTAWECGFALGEKVPVILLEFQHDSIQDMYMVFESVPAKMRFKVDSFASASMEAVVSFLHKKREKDKGADHIIG